MTLPYLTPREKQLARLMAAGNNNHEIAALSDLPEATVRTYKSRLIKKFGARSQVDFVVNFWQKHFHGKNQQG